MENWLSFSIFELLDGDSSTLTSCRRQAAAAGTSKTSARYFINFAFVLLLLHSTETFVRLHWEYYAELRTHKSLCGSQEAAVGLLRLVQPHAAGGQRVSNASRQL